MERTPVESSQLASVGYDYKTSVLEIEFKGKGEEPSRVYQYFDVLPETHQALIEAQSIGRYFGAQIRGKFRFEKLPPPEKAEGVPA